MWYFSPAVIIMGMSQHVLNGSFFVFLAMLLAGIFMGRSFCGYLCPAGGLQECVMEVNPKAAKQGKRNGIKYLIWVVWLAIVIMAFVLGKNDVTIDFFFLTDHGIWSERGLKEGNNGYFLVISAEYPVEKSYFVK